MKKYGIVSAVVLTAVVAMVQCTPATEQPTPAAQNAAPTEPATPAQSASGPGNDRKTVIHMTKNHLLGKPGQKYETVCIGIVATEVLTADKNEKVSWKIRNGTGEDARDDCPDYKPQSVTLHFTSNAAFGADILESDGSNISGKVVESAEKVFKYQVYYVNNAGAQKPGGPDPEIIVNCDGCAPGGEGGPPGGGSTTPPPPPPQQ